MAVTNLLFKVSREPYGGASVTGLTNLLYEVKRLTMHIQPVTCLLRKSSSGAYRRQSLNIHTYHLLLLLPLGDGPDHACAHLSGPVPGRLPHLCIFEAESL